MGSFPYSNPNTLHKEKHIRGFFEKPIEKVVICFKNNDSMQGGPLLTSRAVLKLVKVRDLMFMYVNGMM